MKSLILVSYAFMTCLACGADQLDEQAAETMERSWYDFSCDQRFVVEQSIKLNCLCPQSDDWQEQSWTTNYTADEAGCERLASDHGKLSCSSSPLTQTIHFKVSGRCEPK